MKFIEIIRKFEKLLNWWEPQNIFYWKKWVIENNANINKKFTTKLQKKLDKLPLLFEMSFKTLYYCISWPIYYMICVIWFVLTSIFIPQHLLEDK